MLHFYPEICFQEWKHSHCHDGLLHVMILNIAGKTLTHTTNICYAFGTRCCCTTSHVCPKLKQVSNILSIHCGRRSSPRVCTSHAGTPKILIHQLSTKKEVSIFLPAGWGIRNMARKKSKEPALEWYNGKGPEYWGSIDYTKGVYMCCPKNESVSSKFVKR